MAENDVPDQLALVMVGASGLEPLTPCVSSRYSNQLSYAPTVPGAGLEPARSEYFSGF